MSVIPEHFRLDAQPIANQYSVVHFGNARFTILTSRLIRLEYQENHNFEDRATQAIWYRNQPTPEFDSYIEQDTLVIKTTDLTLTFTETGEGFTDNNLSIHIYSMDTVWQPGMPDDENLMGTIRTLDFINGAAPLSKGLISRAGWSVIDDSSTLVFNEEGWLEPRNNSGSDFYFLGYGHDYKACIQDYCKISGQVPLIPKWALGNWWSRFWAYTQDELTQLIHDFDDHEMPLSVCIIDMDWHITETGNDCSGWTGYTWNRELFPDPEGFIEFLHAHGLRTALNLHPAEGIHPHEEQYEAMATRLGIDPASQQPIVFDITDPEFVNAYLEELHYPNEEMGVDFWWIDWQQGLESKLQGLDPLWLINHLHFYDSGREQKTRPFIFSRWGDYGHQRYPIGFSGDSYITWETLAFQPYMTATASNVAYGWWSHDIGGHISGTSDEELFLRWVQFGVFSPIMRIHTTKGYFYERRPWMLGNAEIENNLREAMQLRHRLIPYIYTMAHRASEESLPLMLPMYYEYPEQDEAYCCPQQYLFGTELIVAPFVEPIDEMTGMSRQVVWLPEGDWYHFSTGEYFEGDSFHSIFGGLRDVPVFAKAGAIVPLGAWDTAKHPDTLEIHIFAGADNQFELYEDDGETLHYQHGRFAKTLMEQTGNGHSLKFTIHPTEGDLSVVPESRCVSVVIHGVTESSEANLIVGGRRMPIELFYDADTESLKLEGVQLRNDESYSLEITSADGQVVSRRDRRKENLLKMIGHFNLHTGVRNQMAEQIDQIIHDPTVFASLSVALSDSQIRALCETLYSAGIQVIEDTSNPRLIVIWNNQQNEAVTYRYNELYLWFGAVDSQDFAQGIAPKFLAIVPRMKAWSHGAMKEHVHLTQWLIQMDYANTYTQRCAYQEQTP